MATRLSHRVTLAITAVTFALVAIAAGLYFTELTAAQQPRTFYDTGAYFQIAERPLGIGLFELAKPPTVPLVYRAADRDAAVIETWQRPVAFIAWLALALGLVCALRHPAARAAGGLVMFGMALAPARLGWTAVVLSESIDDSLLALVLACALGLAAAHRLAPRARGIVRTSLGVALVFALIAWVFARDTNALAVIVSIACAAGVWWKEIRAGQARWAMLPLVFGLVAALFDLTSARAAPSEPLGFQTGWAPALTSRTAFPAVNNLLLRVMPDADGRAFYVDHGLPIAQVEPFATPPRNDDFVHADPGRAEAQAWIAANGTTTFVSWLVHDPGARAGEVWRARVMFVAPDTHRYMPPGWIATDPDHPALQLLRRLTASRWVLLGMLILAPFALYRPRADPRAALALCVIVGALAAAGASFYGDALEPDRHCYGAAQMLAAGLVIALAVGLDRLVARVQRGPGPPQVG